MTDTKKTPAKKTPKRNPKSVALDAFYAAHDAGPARHGMRWIKANQIAVAALDAAGIDASETMIKSAVSVAVLAILDKNA